MKIIGMVGKKGSGKSTLAQNILLHYNDSLAKRGIRLAFADPIKEFCYNVMGLTYAQCYGTDEDKNTLTKYKWENLPHYSNIWSKYLLDTILHKEEVSPPPKGYMTAREIFQEFGTGIFRKMNPNIWIDALDRKISYINNALIIVDDCRFKNEFDYLKSKNAYIIKLDRGNSNDNHQSENDLNQYGDYDLVIPGSFSQEESLQLFLGSYQF